jgi:predicted SAM-dependent methyltransferase
MKILNVGSGARCNPDWTNLDLMARPRHLAKRMTNSLPPNFVRHRLPRPLPFADEAFDAIYCAQVIEHFPKDIAAGVLAEFRRVLRPGGIARVIVPDFEAQCRMYLEALAQTDGSTTEAADERYRFAKLWILDQMVRTSPGGELARFARSPIADDLRDEMRLGSNSQSRRGALFARLPTPIQHARVLTDGELHRWAYDRNDFSSALTTVGFTSVELVQFDVSQIDEFARFDRDSRGEIQTGSLYAEATR